MKKTILILTLFIAISISAIAQDVKISGVIRSSKDSSVLSGASVKIEGTTHGTIANTTGGYAISCPINAVLIITALGYTSKEVPVNGNDQIDVLLTPATENQLGDVVVTALGIKKSKEQVSYATQEVIGATLQKAPEANVASNLVGKVAGLSIATKSTMFEDPTVMLRGAATLVVLDGVPTDRNSFNFWSIDPNNIENITVLKGTAAAALYGSDGINGAIMITTRTGKNGANGSEISFNSTNQFQGGFLRLPKTQNQYGMGWNGYYAFIDGQGGGGWYDDYGYVWGPKLNQKDPSTPSGYVEAPQYNSPYDPNTYYTFTESGSTDQSHYKPLPLITRGTNNLQNFLNKELITTDNVSFSGKTDKSDFRISLTNMYQKGQIPNTQLNSTTLMLSGSLQVNKQLKVSGILSYNRQNYPNYPANSTQASGSSGSGPGDVFYNILLWMGPDVDIRDLRNYWKAGGANPRPGSYAYGTQNLQQYNYNYTWYNNPYFAAYQNTNAYTNNVINAQLNLNYQFNKDLNLLVRSAVATNNDQYTDKEPWSYIDNAFKLQPQGGFSLSQDNNFQIVTDVLLTYKNTFFNDFHATVAAGGSSRYNQLGTTYEGTVGGLNIPDYYNLAASVQPATSTNESAETQSSSIMGYADVDYKNMIYAGITGRNDWVSNLPKPNNSFFYPSANLGVVLSKLLKLPAAISYFKVRGSWAQISDNLINIPGLDKYNLPYASLPTYTPGTRWNSNASLELPSTLISSTLKPNTTISMEYGAEMNFLKNRVGLDVTYYHYLQKNPLTEAPLSDASGYDNVFVNGGSTVRKGLEIVLNATAIQTKDFKWNISANWDEGHTYRKSYYGGATIENGIKVGSRTDQYFNTAWETSPDGQVVYDGNGNPIPTPYNTNLGKLDPNWEFGLSNNFSYKNFSISVSFDGRIGGILFDGVEAQMYDGGNHPATANSYSDDAYQGKATYLPKGVNVTGGNVTYDPNDGHVISDTRTFTANTTKVNYITWVRNYYRGAAQSTEIYNRSFVKLREILFTYTMGQKFISKTPFKAASISVTGRNLFLWTKVPFMDPDGYNNYAIPEPSYRNIGINLNLKF